MPAGKYERTADHRAKLSAAMKRRFANPDYKEKQSEHLKRLRDDPALKEAQQRAFDNHSDKRKWMAATGCSNAQYLKAYRRWKNNEENHNATAFSMEQEIARAMNRPDGKVVTGYTRKVQAAKIQANGEVPMPVRRKKQSPRAPDASAVPPPMDGCWAEDPLPCESELVDEEFMFEVRKSLVLLHVKMNKPMTGVWIHELD